MGKFCVVVIVVHMVLSGIAWGENRQVQGIILDESGKPVAGAELFLYDSPKTRRPADFISGKTGIDGRFTMKVPSGVYWGVARVRHGDTYGPLLSGDLHSGEPKEIDLSAGGETISFTVADIRELSRLREKHRSDMARLSGKVHDQSGRAVSPATVYVWREPFNDRTPDLISSWTEKDGGYLLYIAPGTYSVMASTAFPPLISEGKPVKLTVTESQKSIALNLQVIKMEDDSTGSSVNVPSDGIPLDDE